LLLDLVELSSRKLVFGIERVGMKLFQHELGFFGSILHQKPPGTFWDEGQATK
jgi:hypothetical protein